MKNKDYEPRATGGCLIMLIALIMSSCITIRIVHEYPVVDTVYVEQEKIFPYWNEPYYIDPMPNWTLPENYYPFDTSYNIILDTNFNWLNYSDTINQFRFPNNIKFERDTFFIN